MILADVRPRLKRTIGLAIGLVLLFTAFAVYLIHYSLSSQERLYIDVSRNVAQRVQTIKEEQLTNSNLEIAWLNETVAFVLNGNSAWADERIAEYMHGELDIDFSAVLRPDNTIQYYASSFPEFGQTWATQLIGEQLDTLLKEARNAHHHEPVTEFGNFLLDGQLVMVAATLIVPDIGAEQFSDYKYDHVLLSGRIIDDNYVRLLGILLDLKHTRLDDCSAKSEARLAITGPQGECLRAITWDILGNESLYQDMLLIVCIYLLLVMALAFALFRDLYGLTNQFAEHANVDDMTGLYNRRYFNAIARDEIARFCRDQSVGAFMLLDIDNFKKLNDHYGHQAGDDALRQVGTTIRTAFRRISDYAFRLGGEEFGVIYVVREIDEVKVIAEKLCRDIESLNIDNRDNAPFGKLTVSIGVYLSKTDNRDCKLEQAYAKADQALYKAKRNGRNRVEYYEDRPD